MNHDITAYENQERAVTLTNAEWNRLACFLLMTTNYREGERDTWLELADDPRVPYAAENAACWQQHIDLADKLIKML